MAVKRNGQDEAEAEAATAPSQAGAPKSHTPKATAPKASARSRTARKATNDPPAPTASTTKAPPSKAPTPKAKGSAPTPPGVTPSIARFLEIKAANPDSLLFYRMGDFYELFFEDAVAAAAALNIVLTKRGQHLGKEIPMCGVPVARADEYLQRLIRAGFRVAVCEQMEDPAEAKKRGANAVVRRDVVRLVTPGTLTEDTLLEGHASNFLTALFVRGGKDASRSANGDTGSDKQGDPTRRQSAKADATGDAGMVALASIDISTGDTELACLARADLAGELARLSPREILIADRLNEDAAWRARLDATGAAITPLPQAHFSAGHGERALTQRLGVATLGAFGAFTRDELAAAGALMTYIDLTQLGATPVIRTPRRVEADTIMLIDAASRASLELTRTASGARQGSLLHALDRTVTGAGARELAARLTGPLRDPRAIRARLDAVGYFVERERLRSDLRGCLKRTPDLARAVARLSFNRGGPRDLQSVRDALHAADALHALLQSDAMAMGLPAVLHEVSATLQAADGELRVALSALLAEEVPVHRREGGFVREGYNGELDEARALRDDSRAVMAGLEARYAEVTGVRGLKVRHNNILGFFIEVSAAQADALMAPPHAQTFIHRQTMANAMRFRTDELTALEGKIAAAADRAIALELTLFNEAASMIAQAQALLHALAQALAVLDHYAGLAELAVEQRYRRPDIDEGTGFEIIGGRHAVVEQALARQRDGSGGPFIANDCTLGRFIPAPTGFDEAPTPHIWLVTGPNMAGKSTFLRQNALMAVMAQMGSFLPVDEARLGVVDRLFSRVGASDDIASGRSTFMVEMVETAAILNQASARSLVILDEIGRGTATFDGVSIAWASVEYLHDVLRCRALFATHYHELTALSERLTGLANVTVDVREWRDEIVFLHKVKSGAADRSYGIQVAKLAGLPDAVVARAHAVLEQLEASDTGGGPGGAGGLEDLPLFAATRPKGGLAGSEQASAEAAALRDALRAVEPDELTPREALDVLYRLKTLAPPDQP